MRFVAVSGKDRDISPLNYRGEGCARPLAARGEGYGTGATASSGCALASLSGYLARRRKRPRPRIRTGHRREEWARGIAGIFRGVETWGSCCRRRVTRESTEWKTSRGMTPRRTCGREPGAECAVDAMNHRTWEEVPVRARYI